MIVSMLAGLGHQLRHLLRAAGLAKSTYYHLLSHPAAVTRPDIEPMVAEIFARTPNGCGHRQIRMCLVHEFGVRVSHKSVLKVMRRMGLECRIRRPNPYREYSSYRGETGARVENLLNRDFTADRPWVKLGTDVTEFRVADGKAYLAPVYDMGSKEIVAWDVSRHPDMAQQWRLLAMLEEKLPEDANPILHSDMGWQYRHRWWRDRAGVRPPQGRVLRRTRVRLIRTVQERTGRVHHRLEHQTPPDTTGGTHPGGIPEHVPHSLIRYP